MDRTRTAMLISVPTDQDLATNLSTKLRSLPTLVEVYVLIVDQVLRKHGFDPDRCEFLAEQALPRSEFSEEGSIPSRSAYCLQASRVGPISSNAQEWSQFSESGMSCGQEDQLAIAG